MSTIENNNRIDYIEMKVKDIEATKKFYGQIFGWDFQDYGPTYTCFNDGRLNAGFEKSEDLKTGNNILVVLYYQDLEVILDKVKEAGGKITRETYEFPGGRRFHFHDPSGNELAIWSEK